MKTRLLKRLRKEAIRELYIHSRVSDGIEAFFVCRKRSYGHDFITYRPTLEQIKAELYAQRKVYILNIIRDLRDKKKAETSFSKKLIKEINAKCYE